MPGNDRSLIAVRDHESLTFETRDGWVPNRDQWLRDYIDKHVVSDGMVVLIATVSDDNEVTELQVNRECATDHAKRVADADNGINLITTEANETQ